MKQRKILATASERNLARASVSLIIAALALHAQTTIADGLSFYQMNFDLDGTVYNNTEWGAADVSFTGQFAPQYINIAVNDSWQVQNMPLIAPDGAGAATTIRYYFDLGVARGTPVSSLHYSYSISSSPISSVPVGATAATVSPGQYTFYSGIQGEVGSGLAAVGPLIGSQIQNSACNPGFPLLEQGNNECTPTAVLESLMFLKNTKVPGIP
jgi:hypothetical protein